MKNKIVGYIVTNEYFSEPLELVGHESYPWPVLLRGDAVTVFTTRKAANGAIEKTLEWARTREYEEDDLGPLEWAEKDKYKIWRLCGNGIEAINPASGKVPHTPTGATRPRG